MAHLFRAASKAESIHRESHKQAILALGGKIKDFKLDEVKVGTTAENLKAAIKGESYERDTMYPEFLALAKQDGAKEAMRTFVYAQKAETEHAKLYQAALDNLGQTGGCDVLCLQDMRLYDHRVAGQQLPVCREPVSNYELID